MINAIFLIAWLSVIGIVWLFIRGATNYQAKKRFMVPQAIRYPWYVRLWKFLNKKNIEWS